MIYWIILWIIHFLLLLLLVIIKITEVVVTIFLLHLLLLHHGLNVIWPPGSGIFYPQRDQKTGELVEEGGLHLALARVDELQQPAQLPPADLAHDHPGHRLLVAVLDAHQGAAQHRAGDGEDRGVTREHAAVPRHQLHVRGGGRAVPGVEPGAELPGDHPRLGVQPHPLQLHGAEHWAASWDGI